MTGIRANLDTADFASLVEAARAVIPANAAGWTDHNIHDPGIMLIELMAHVADSQIYSLSRLRQDERTAFAAILNAWRKGPSPASVLLWPLLATPAGTNPLAAFSGQEIAAEASIAADLPGTPAFRAIEAFSVSGIRIESVCTETAAGEVIDWGDPGTVERAAFCPFASDLTPRDALVLRCRVEKTVPQAPSEQSPLSLGIEVLQSGETPEVMGRRQFLSLSVRHGVDERPLRILADGTSGLFRTGTLRFVRPRDLDQRFDLILRPTGSGLLRRPCLRRIAFDVFSAEQVETVTETAPDFGTGLPDQVWKAGRSGRIETLALGVETLDRAGVRRDWKPGDLETAGPNALVFGLDEGDGSIRFGNGVNGRAPEAGEALTVRYRVSDGSRGNVASVTTWTVRGLSGPGWFNPAPADHGSDAETMSHLQTRVRRELALAPQCVTGADLVAAARGVRGFAADALVLPESASGPHGAGAVTTLMAWIVEPAGSARDQAVWQVPSRAWLQELRAKLRPQVPIGRSLEVVAPQPVRIGVNAELSLEPRADASTVLMRCTEMLQRRLGLRPADVRDASLAAPATIALSMVRGWLRAEPGVRAVVSAVLTFDGRVAGPTIQLRPRERCVTDIGPQSLRIAEAGREDAR